MYLAHHELGSVIIVIITIIIIIHQHCESLAMIHDLPGFAIRLQQSKL